MVGQMDQDRVPTRPIQPSRNSFIPEIVGRHQSMKKKQRWRRPTLLAKENPGSGDIVFSVPTANRALPTEQRSRKFRSPHRSKREKFCTLHFFPLGQIVFDLLST